MSKGLQVKRSTSQNGPQVKRSTSQKVPKSEGLQVKRSPVKRSPVKRSTKSNVEAKTTSHPAFFWITFIFSNFVADKWHGIYEKIQIL